MADINDLVAKYVPEKDVPVAGENTFFDEKNNTVVVKNAFGTSLYDPSGNLLYGKGALYDTNIGSVTGKNVQIFGRNDEIGAEASGVEGSTERARRQRLAKESAYSTGGTKGLVNYLNADDTTEDEDSFGGGIYTASDGRKFNDPDTFAVYQEKLDEKKAGRKSAYDLLYSEFKNYGLEALVTPLKGLIEEGISPSEFTLRLRETDAYKKRFAANAQRVAKGLRALSEAEYIGTEDQYQDVMRRYGMPESYYTKGEMGIQSGFEKFLAGDVSAVELEDRIQTAQNRVVKSNPEVAKALKEFYPGISNGDILSYVLDPTNAIENIKRKVTAAEIGGAAMTPKDAMGRSILTTSEARAIELAGYGVDKASATEGYSAIGAGLQRGSELASIYGQSPYTQATAESEIFKLSGQQEARKQRQKVTGLEKATFGGQTGITSGALARDRAGGY